jgi:tetratricopeptide (TPR) repeat protein
LKGLTQILCVLFLFGFGCKTVENTKSSVHTLNYKQQIAFEKVFFEASKQKLLNNKEKASTLYTEALNLHPSCHACMHELSALNYEQKKYFLALEFAQKAVQNNTKYNQWYFDLVANSYKKIGMFEQSALVYSDMVELSPYERSNYLKSASAYSQVRFYDKAILMLRKMQNQFGIEHASSMQLESIFSSMGETEKAIEVLEEISNRHPDKIIYLGRLSDIYIRDKQDDLAIATLKKIIEIDSTSGKANFALYMIYIGKGDKLSSYYLKKVMSCDDISLEIKLQAISPLLKVIKTNRQKKKELMELSEIVLENYPSRAEVYFFISDMHVVLDDHKSARLSMRQALQRDPVSFTIWKKILYLDEQLFDYKQQLKDVNSALELFPNVAKLYHVKSKALNQLSEYEQALKIAEEGLFIAIDKEDKIDLMIAKGQAYMNLGKDEKASQLIESVLSIDPNHVSALNTYSNVLINQDSQLDEAEGFIEKALVIEPHNAELLATKATIWFRKKDTDMALELLEKAISINPKNVKYFVQKKLIYEFLGDKANVEKMKLKIKNLHEE